MTTLQTGLEDAHYFSVARFNSHIYFSNGWDPVYRWNGVAAALVVTGIGDPPQNWTAATASSAAGNTTAGNHVLRFRYKSKDTGYISNPSNHVEKNFVAGATAITFDIDNVGGGPIKRSADSKVDQIVVEMTTVESGSPFYEAVTVANSAATVTVNISDASLVGNPLDWEDDGHDAPVRVPIIVAHRGRLIGGGAVVHSEGTCDVTNGDATVSNGSGTNFTDAVIGRFFQRSGDATYYKIASKTSGTELELDATYGGATGAGVSYSIFSLAPTTLYESLALYPESWPPLAFTKALVNKADRVKAIIPFFGDLIVCGDATAEKWSYNEGLSTDGQAYPIPGERGCLNQRCWVEESGVIYGWDRQGFWQFAGAEQTHISYPIDPLLQIMNWSVDHTFHAVFIPGEREIRWYFARDDDDVTDTLPKDFISYHVDKKTWATGRHVMAITASKVINTGKERRACLGDENGRTWFVVGSTEGVHPTSTKIGTVLAGAAAGVFSISEGALYVTGDGLAGATCYWVEGNEERIIASNTATEITLATAFTQAPATGDKVHLGRINCLLKTKAIALNRLSEISKPRYLWVYFEPTATEKILRVRFYENYATTATTLAQTVVDLTDGVDITSGASDFLIDMSKTSGRAKIPIGFAWNSVIEMEFEIRETSTGAYLIGYEIDGVAAEVMRAL